MALDLDPHADDAQPTLFDPPPTRPIPVGAVTQPVYLPDSDRPEENEGVVDHLLKNREATLLPIQWDLDCEPGLSEWNKEKYDKQLHRAVRLYPHRIDSVGFFMARIGKSG